MRINIIDKPSKNFDDVNIRPEWIVLHCIGYEEEKALSILTQKTDDTPPVSAHFFIPHRKSLNHLDSRPRGNDTLNFPIYQLVPENKFARHAGDSQWQNIKDLSAHSIGIEFHLPNYANALTKDTSLNWYHFERFTEEQIHAGIQLIKLLCEKHSIPPAHILYHSDIAPWRMINDQLVPAKTDPGVYFPAKLLAETGLGAWPIEERTRTGEINLEISHIQKLLHSVGYRINLTGDLDAQTQYVIKAFKIHYMPEEYKNDDISADISPRMVTLLENLVDKKTL